jgi:site-specific recombinase XerC
VAAGARDAALVALLVAGGLRRSEAAALDLDDYDPETGALKVWGKGGKERVACLTGRAAETTLCKSNYCEHLYHRDAPPCTGDFADSRACYELSGRNMWAGVVMPTISCDAALLLGHEGLSAERPKMKNG